MGYKDSLLLAVVLVSHLPAQGNEACYEVSWSYHRQTHTCVKLYRIDKGWTEAREYCHQLQLGSQFGVTPGLVIINDTETNEFVKSLITEEGLEAWIGLHFMPDKVAFRWLGYPDETPKFRDANWTQPTRPYVTMTAWGWRGEDESETRPFLCQKRAKAIDTVSCEQEVQAEGLNLRCTSGDSPTKANCQWTYKYKDGSTFQQWRLITNETHEQQTTAGNTTTYTTTCSVILTKENAHIKEGTFQFKLKMYPNFSVAHMDTNENALSSGSLEVEIARPQKPNFKLSDKYVTGPVAIVVQGSNNIPLQCEIHTGSPAVHSIDLSCESPMTTNMNSQVNRGPQAYTLTIRQAMREMDGRKCTCLGHHMTGNTEDSILTFKVVTKPTDVTCQSELHPEGLVVSCLIGKIYPEALCVWSYRNENDRSFKPVPNTVITRYSNESKYTGIDGILYWRSVCSITLPPGSINFRPGNLIVQATINPKIEGIHRDTTHDAFMTSQVTVMIDPPHEAHLRMLGRNAFGASPLVEDEEIDLSCEVNSGTPPVYSTTLSCEFSPVDADAGYERTVPGTHDVINRRVSHDMHGKNCTCIGNHLTGPKQSPPLSFQVVCKPSHVTCSSNLRPHGLLVKCVIRKINPEAVCKFSYLNENDPHFTPLPDSHMIDYDHESYVDSNGFTYYKSNCSFTFSPDTITLRPGALTVHVTMNPNYENIDKRTTSGAFITTQEIVNIEPPDKPTIKAFTRMGGAWPTDQSNENQTIFVECEVKSGKPKVHSVTLACDFPMNDLGDYQLTAQGTSYVINMLSHDLEGKNCTCIGNHVTGSIQSEPLILGVLDAIPSGQDSSSSLSTVAIVGLIILGFLIIAIAVTGGSMIGYRKFRQRRQHVTICESERQNTSQGNVNQRVPEEAPQVPHRSTSLSENDDAEQTKRMEIY